MKAYKSYKIRFNHGVQIYFGYYCLYWFWCHWKNKWVFQKNEYNARTVYSFWMFYFDISRDTNDDGWRIRK
jgi:hypothetical protein